jgi:hypothetical protein
MSAVTASLLVLSVAFISWLCTRVRWRSRVARLEARWSSIRDQLLDEMGRLQQEVMRARARAAQLTRDAAAWADGYKHGRDDMIRATAALQREVVPADDPAGQASARK